MLVTIDFLEANYNKFNNEYFYGKLPKVSFKISNSKRTWGSASFKFDWLNKTIVPEKITISNYYDSPKEIKLNTLLHEMIHIYDYACFPEHFIKNGKRVGYDAHGTWFKSECKRLKKYGWNIETTTTNEEVELSTLSNHSKELLNNKIDKALLCVIYGNNGLNFLVKTNTDNINNIINSIKCVNWKINLNGISDIKFYKFSHEELASIKSCGKRLRGWRYDINMLKEKLNEYKAHEYKINGMSDIIKKCA